MSGDGFDTWVLEVRGAGLSINGVKNPLNAKSVNHGKDGIFPSGQHFTANLGALADLDISSAENKGTYMVSKLGQFQLPTKLMKTFMHLSERLSGFLNEGWSKQFLVGDMIWYLKA